MSLHLIIFLKNTYVVCDMFIPLRAVAIDGGHIVAETHLAISRAL
jgi:hypothetical protein